MADTLLITPKASTNMLDTNPCMNMPLNTTPTVDMFPIRNTWRTVARLTRLLVVKLRSVTGKN
jgi:hypothetical protein